MEGQTVKRRLALALIAVLAVSLIAWALWPDRGPGDDISGLADRVARGEGAALKEEAKAVALKYPTARPVMSVFKLRGGKGGGLGIGRKSGAIQPDGIDAKIASLARTALTPAELDEQGEALIRMSEVIVAVAEVIRHKCEVRQKTGYLDPKDWARWCEGLQQSSSELAEAVRARDAARVKNAATQVRATCTSCHRIFRE
jgi:hypothetical protein